MTLYCCTRFMFRIRRSQCLSLGVAVLDMFVYIIFWGLQCSHSTNRAPRRRGRRSTRRPSTFLLFPLLPPWCLLPAGCLPFSLTFLSGNLLRQACRQRPARSRRAAGLMSLSPLSSSRGGSCWCWCKLACGGCRMVGGEAHGGVPASLALSLLLCICP